MAGLGALLVVIGIICLIYGGMQKFKAGRLAKAPFVKTGDAASQGAGVAGDKGAISAEGNVAHGDLVISAVTQTPCLYYEYKVSASWKKGDKTRTKELAKGKEAAGFTIDDGSGAVTVSAEQGGDFDGIETTLNETKARGLISGIKGENLQFGDKGFNVDPSPFPGGAKITVVEKVLKPAEKFYVCGKIDETNTIGSPSWTSLIISTKSRDELMGATAKAAKNFLIGGAAATVIGGIMAALGGGGSAATGG